MSILKTVGIIVGAFIVVFGVLDLAHCSLVYFSNEPAKQVAIEHEMQLQKSELQHRIKVCNELVDSMGPDYSSSATFQCAMMYSQMRKLQVFAQKLGVKDPQIYVLSEAALRSAARYYEYQHNLNQPIFKPAPEQE